MVWTLNDYNGDSFSVGTNNYTSIHPTETNSLTPYVNISTSTGELYIEVVSSTMRGKTATFFNCSILNSDSQLCGTAMNEVIIFTPGESWCSKGEGPVSQISDVSPFIRRLRCYYGYRFLFLSCCVETTVSESPTIHMLPDSEAIIGRGTAICLEGSIGGTNGENFWTVGDSTVSATDITNLTNPGNSNEVLNFTDPICDTCSCYQKYSRIPAVASMLSGDLQETGFASFIVTMFVIGNTDSVNINNRLCYGLQNRFIAVLMVKEVTRGSQGPLNIAITVTSAYPFRLTRNFNLNACKRTSVCPSLSVGCI